MPFFLLDDQFADDPLFDALAGGKPALEDALRSAWSRLCSKSSHLTTDGYLTEALAMQYCRGRRAVLQLLTQPALGRAPLLHRRGDECECLGDEWTPGYGYRLHKFLRRNPSRREYERNREQKADLRDPRLKAMVYERDGGCCRYCRSGQLSPKAGRSRDRRKVLCYDHVDPDAPAGPDGANLVVSCGACNEYKGKRTPPEADMVLLPPPTPAQAGAWRMRGPAVFDRGEITDESPTDHRPDDDPNGEPFTDRTGEPGADRLHQRHDPAHPDGPEHTTAQAGDWSGKPPGLGRGGAPDPDPPPPRPGGPARTQADPDIYHRRSRRPPANTGRRCRWCGQPVDPAVGNTHPLCEQERETAWPPGATPTRPTP